MTQNRSHAVMAQRIEAKDSRDDFPTPPWATRSLFEHVIFEFGPFSSQSVLEPACGAGHMAKVLKEHFREARASDAYACGPGTVRDYLKAPYEANAVDWVIINPPFRLAEEFVHRSLIVVMYKGVNSSGHIRILSGAMQPHRYESNCSSASSSGPDSPFRTGVAAGCRAPPPNRVQLAPLSCH